jgi:hypothetical protein
VGRGESEGAGQFHAPKMPVTYWPKPLLRSHLSGHIEISFKTVAERRSTCVNACAELVDLTRQRQSRRGRPPVRRSARETSMSGKKAAVTHVLMILGLVMASVTLTQLQVLSIWSPTGSMSEPRGSSVATLLQDGRVLDTGGWGYSVDYPGSATPVAKAELYDPMLGTWTPTAAMSTPRSQHTVSLLRDGRVLVTGGMRASSILASAEIYSPALGTWSPTGSMGVSRYYHTATVLRDGRVLVVGGGGGEARSAEIYDPALGTWSPIPLMNTLRFVHAATLLQDGRVLVSGGLYDAVNTTDSVEIYDPALGTWSVTGSMTADRTGHAATLLSDGRVLVNGGYSHQTYEYYDENGFPVSYTEASYWQSAEIYDPVSGTWSPTGSMRAGSRYWHPSTLLSDGRVLVSGGLTYSQNPVLASAEVYNPSTGTWSLTAAMSTPRWGLTPTLLPDGQVLVSGGYAGPVTANTILASAEIYSPGPPSPEDTTPPQVSCAAPDGAWHNNDVTIACTASDAGSGLANSADVTFNLTTTVPGGTETANAETNSRQVCDTEGNCNTAGPVVGNKVDKKAPTITIASPIAGATYRVNAKAAASYACSDGGSGVTSCAGTVANGSPITTSSTGTRTFVVTANDAVGNASTRSVTYTVTSGKK